MKLFFYNLFFWVYDIIYDVSISVLKSFYLDCGFGFLFCDFNFFIKCVYYNFVCSINLMNIFFMSNFVIVWVFFKMFEYMLQDSVKFFLLGVEIVDYRGEN